MHANVMLILLLALLTRLQASAGDEAVVVKVSERDLNKDGVTDIRIETHLRNGQPVLKVTDFRNKKGVMVRSVSYLVGGKLVATETDEDGDGFRELFTLIDTSTGGEEAFLRSQDGTVSPVPTDTLNAIRKDSLLIKDAPNRMMKEILKKEDSIKPPGNKKGK